MKINIGSIVVRRFTISILCGSVILIMPKKGNTAVTRASYYSRPLDVGSFPTGHYGSCKHAELIFLGMMCRYYLYHTQKRA